MCSLSSNKENVYFAYFHTRYLIYSMYLTPLVSGMPNLLRNAIRQSARSFVRRFRSEPCQASFCAVCLLQHNNVALQSCLDGILPCHYYNKIRWIFEMSCYHRVNSGPSRKRTQDLQPANQMPSFPEGETMRITLLLVVERYKYFVIPVVIVGKQWDRKDENLLQHFQTIWVFKKAEDTRSGEARTCLIIQSYGYIYTACYQVKITVDVSFAMPTCVSKKTTSRWTRVS